MTLIALVSGGAWLAFADRAAPGQDAAERLSLLLLRAERDAISSGDFVGVAIAPDRADVLRYRDGVWQRDDRVLPGGLQLGDGMVLRVANTPRRAVEATGRADRLPALWFDPTGANEPTVLILETAGPRYRIELSAGQVHVEATG